MATIGEAARRIQKERAAWAQGKSVPSGDAWTRATASQTKVPKKKIIPIMTDTSGEARTRATMDQTKILEKRTSTGTAPTVSGGRDYSKMSETELRRLASVGRNRDYSKLPENQYRYLESHAQIDLDEDAMYYFSELGRLKRLAAGKQTAGDRAGNTFASAAASYTAPLVNLAGLYGEVAYEIPMKTAVSLLTGKDSTASQIARRGSDEINKLVYGAADTLSGMGATAAEDAKSGMGVVGQLAVDTGIAGAQMGGDALLSALTKGAVPPIAIMAARSGGGAAQEARQAGASTGQQLAYGLGSAALSVGTEKIANIAGPFKKMFGSGAAEKIAGKLVDKFGDRAAGQVMQKLSQTAMGRLALNAIGEGAEELIEDFVQPYLKRAIYDPDARFDWGEAGYDTLIGMILGGVGSGVEALGAVRQSPSTATVRGDTSLGTGTVRKRNDVLPPDTEHDTMETERTVTKRGEEIRQESNRGFVRRSQQEAHGIYKGRNSTFGFRRPLVPRVSEAARSIQKELTALGVPSFLTDGSLEWNRNGLTRTRLISEATTYAGEGVFINGVTTLSPRYAAGHEAYHYWKETEARNAFTSILRDNLIFYSDAFIDYQDIVAQAYLGESADIFNQTQMNRLMEEVYAYICGYIHEGTGVSMLKGFLRDYDEVKTAWETLTETMRGQAGSDSLTTVEEAPAGWVKLYQRLLEEMNTKKTLEDLARAYQENMKRLNDEETLRNLKWFYERNLGNPMREPEDEDEEQGWDWDRDWDWPYPGENPVHIYH